MEDGREIMETHRDLNYISLFAQYSVIAQFDNCYKWNNGMFSFYGLRIYFAKVASVKAWQRKLRSQFIYYWAWVDVLQFTSGKLQGATRLCVFEGLNVVTGLGVANVLN